MERCTIQRTRSEEEIFSETITAAKCFDGWTRYRQPVIFIWAIALPVHNFYDNYWLYRKARLEEVDWDLPMKRHSSTRLFEAYDQRTFCFFLPNGWFIIIVLFFHALGCVFVPWPRWREGFKNAGHDEERFFFLVHICHWFMSNLPGTSSIQKHVTSKNQSNTPI